MTALTLACPASSRGRGCVPAPHSSPTRIRPAAVSLLPGGSLLRPHSLSILDELSDDA